MKQQPFASPGEALEHYGVKGMRWGVRKEEDASPRETARKNETAKSQVALKPVPPGTPDFEARVQRLTRTDRPQVLPAPSGGGAQGQGEKHGLTSEQKLLITFGAVSVAAAGYYAYTKYSGNQMPGLDLEKARQEVQKLDEMKLPKNWDVRGLKDAPLSTSPLGKLGGGTGAAALLDAENLVVNTSRGYADILPKNGFDNPFAAEQHASVTRVLEEMRDKFPAIRNMNIEVLPMSKMPGIGADAHMCVLPMGPGEARVMYNDLMKAPSAFDIRANRNFLPGLGKKDYVAYHEMGHLLAVAHGELPPAIHLLKGEAGPAAWRTRDKAEKLLHKKMFLKHGFTFKELSKLSHYAATEPAEAMAELVGHYFQPEMRARLTPDQVKRAEAMIFEMGGLT